jgi:hypothetical protein
MPHLASRRKRRWWIVPAGILVLLAVPPPERPAIPPVVWHEVHAPAGADAVLAGAAKGPLPVPAHVHLAGYGPLRTAKGLRDAPMARALVIETGATEPGAGGTWIIVSLDLLEVSPELVETLRSLLPGPPFALTVLASHTHSGAGGTDPNALAQLLGEGPFDRDLMNGIAAAAATVVLRARARARPATVTFARTDVPALQQERDPGGSPDPTLSVLTAAGRDGQLIGTLAIFGAHPTLLPRQERLLSADWPGAAARELDKGGSVTLVAQGAGGDASVPRAGLPPDPGARIQAFGELFAAAVRHALPPAPEPLSGLGYAAVEIRLPAPNLSRYLPGPLHGAADWLVEWLAPATAEVSVVRLGSQLFYCLPGELTGSARRLDAVAFHAGESLTALALCNGDVSYIEAPELWRSGQGEQLVLFGPDLAERLFDGVRVAADAARPAGP